MNGESYKYKVQEMFAAMFPVIKRRKVVCNEKKMNKKLGPKIERLMLEFKSLVLVIPETSLFELVVQPFIGFCYPIVFMFNLPQVGFPSLPNKDI